jgi:hypothetical protein
MRTNADETEVRIEKEGYAPIVIKKNYETYNFNNYNI